MFSSHCVVLSGCPAWASWIIAVYSNYSCLFAELDSGFLGITDFPRPCISNESYDPMLLPLISYPVRGDVIRTLETLAMIVAMTLF
ncbi:hypothetical protein B0H12DRAFT_1125455 [Mycena haematopus]|nr:hypothetical protein B0H12DRAFT_1125455 [Mycena haematopus]